MTPFLQLRRKSNYSLIYMLEAWVYPMMLGAGIVYTLVYMLMLAIDSQAR